MSDGLSGQTFESLDVASVSEALQGGRIFQDAAPRDGFAPLAMTAEATGWAAGPYQTNRSITAVG